MTGAAVRAQVGVDHRALADFRDRLAQLAKANLAGAMEAVAAAGEEEAKERVASAGPAYADIAGQGPDGESWPAWSDRYAATRTRGKGALHSEGALRDALGSEAGASTAVWGVEGIAYAAVHQFGHVFPSGAQIPARPYVGFGAAERRTLGEALEAFLEGGFNGA